jgi:transposase
MLTRAEGYVDRGREHCEQQQRPRTVAALKRRTAAFGFELTTAPVTT